MNTVLIEGALQFGPSSSDYVHDMIVRMSINCDWVQEGYYHIGAGSAESLNIDPDLTRCLFVVVENLDNTNDVVFVWTDRQTGLANTVTLAGAGTSTKNSACINDPDLSQSLTLQGSGGAADVRVFMGGNL